MQGRDVEDFSLSGSLLNKHNNNINKIDVFISIIKVLRHLFQANLHYTIFFSIDDQGPSDSL